MARAFASATSSTTTLIYTIIAIGVLLLLLASPSPSSRRHHAHRRLKLRSPAANEASRSRLDAPFDPIIADMEHVRDDRTWEREHYPIPADFPPEPEWEEFMDAEDYINDESRFNVTSRTIALFPEIDVRPADDFITLDELVEWNLKQARRDTVRRTLRDMSFYDKNHDGLISPQEYDPPAWARSSGNDAAGWWNEDHFNASDMDEDGLLNITEFTDFLHPADSVNPKVIKWLCKEELRVKDLDKDGKINFQEFFDGLFVPIKNNDGISSQSSEGEAAAKILFHQLDQDNNGFLSDDELIPVIGHIHPSEHYYAKQQAEYMISQADADKDGRLTLTEMIDHPNAFYNSIFSDEGDDYSYHDEF